MLYSLAVERVILYAISIWYSDKVKLALRLISKQRALLLCVTMFYATVAKDSLPVFAEVLQLDLLMRMNRDFTDLVRWQEEIVDAGFPPP